MGKATGVQLHGALQPLQIAGLLWASVSPNEPEEVMLGRGATSVGADRYILYKPLTSDSKPLCADLFTTPFKNFTTSAKNAEVGR